MPADIRSFFGSQASRPPSQHGKAVQSKEDKSAKPNKRRSNARKIVDDSEDDEPPRKISTPKKSIPKKGVQKDSPKGEETTTTDYFASSRKSKLASNATKVKNEPSSTMKAAPIQGSPRSRKESTKEPSSVREPARPSRHNTPYKEPQDSRFLHDGDDPDAGDDIFGSAIGRGRKQKDDKYIEVDSDDDEDVDMNDVRPSADDAKRPKKAPLRNVKAANGNASSDSKKRKSMEPDESDDYASPRKTSKTKLPSKPPSKKARAAASKGESSESNEIQAIFDSIPTVKAPSPPPKDSNSAPFDWRKNAGGNFGPPPAAGAKEVPVGAENCLTGLTFVFTGLLDSISREEGQEIVKRYGGKVTTAPSGKTSYVVLGSDAGPSKLEKIRKLNIKTINEDGLFELIRRLPANGGDGKAAEKSLEKQRADAEKVKQEADEMEKEERMRLAEAEKEAQRAAVARGLAPPPKQSAKSANSDLWTVKYAPTQMNQICGNKGQVEKIQKWLQKWPQAHRVGFQMPGPDGFGTYRSIIIHGPPGIGKTTAAHLAAKLEGYDVIESNASDTRSKKLVEAGMTDVLDNTSLLGYFAGDGKKVDAKKQKIVLIMDEVDGMSAGDRGGVGALAKVCKKTDIPIILICNERKIPKMKPFDFVAYDIPFRRPTVDQVRSRVATICHREGLKLSKEVMDALIEGSNKDIRQIINMLSTAKLDQTVMDFDQGKQMSKAWEKHVVLKPWDICSKLLGGGMFAPSSKSTLNDKIELYFNDHEFSYLMIQENYLSTKPLLATSQGLSPREYKLKVLELADKAAESISDGDLVDRMIHGSQQQWSLMPTHAVFSTVRPASFISGAMTGPTAFTTWLGNNSKYGKLTRYVKEIQSHMRLRTSGDRHEIRQQYLPVLWTQLIKRLENEGKDAVDDVIDLMDSYFLTRDDFDYIMELGLGPQRQEGVKLETQTKSTFTRLYNTRTHPMPFMKATSVVAPAKAAKAIPDLEEAIEEEDEGEVLAEPADEEDDDLDLSKDKYIKKPKAKKAAATKKTAGKKGRTFKDDDNPDECASDEETKPKKSRAGKGKTTATRGKDKK